MATASLRERTRSARTFSRNRSENDEDNVHLDANKDATENAYEILSNICKKQGLTDGRRVAYLNLFVKLMEDVNAGHLPMTIAKKDVICCLRVGLVSSSTTVRAATLRVLRHSITDASDVLIVNKLQIPHLIARSIDIVLKNEHERIQALRLSLRILNLAPKHFSIAVARCLVSLVNSVNENKDRMIYSALFLLCQLCVLNPESAIECTGETCLLRCCIETAQGRINECLVGCLLFLLNKPKTRNKAHLQMDFLTSVYCDLQRKRGNEMNTFLSSRLSILAALRTWTGVFYLCNPNNPSGMKAVISVLYLKDVELRKAIFELFFEILGLDYEDWLKDVDSVLENVDPYRPHDSWRLSEGFVVAEGKDILPHRADTRPNLTEVHTALLVYTFLECGLLTALVEVVVDSDQFLSHQAIVLIGYLLHVSHKLLPSELLDVSPSLPSLLHHVAYGEPQKHMRAVMAMSVLHRVHLILSRRPVPASLFLRLHLLQGLWHKKRNDDVKDRGKNVKNLSKNLELHIRESKMLSTRDPRDWDWAEVSTILKCLQDSFFRLEDDHKSMLRKLVYFYKPSSSQYSSMDYSLRRSMQIHSLAGLQLLDLLIDAPPESEYEKLLNELLVDICREMDCLVDTGSAHDCFLSPTKVATTLSQHYFLMIGHLSSSLKGLNALDRVGALQIWWKIVESTPQDVYVKLIVSSLCYTHSQLARDILTLALTRSRDTIRIYTTEFLLVLARCGVPLFHKWGLDLLIPQIYDKNKLVANITVEILHELSYDPVFLDCLIDTRPSLLHLGDKGQLLLIRFLSTSTGFTYLSDNFVERELEKWEKGYNYRYVGLVEGAVHDALTLHQREENGRYSRRLTNAKHRWKPVWVPPHLYGQLARHAQGFAALEASPCLQRLVTKIQNGNCESDADILDLKTSLWSLANMATSNLGLQFLEDRQLLQAFVNVAQDCPVLSVRATAFYCLSLIATTEEGATLLAQLEWFAVRRNRSDQWPVEVSEKPQNLIPMDDDLTSAQTFSLWDGESAEDLSLITEPQVSFSQNINQRASTLPPGLSGDMDETDFASPPLSMRKKHQRSYSETCSLLLQNNQEPTTPQRLSFQDAAGLATLQTLQASRRPELSSNQLFPEQSRRFSEHRSSSPMTEFEAENPPRLYSQPSSASLSSMDDVPKTETQLPGGPVYRGICLPRALIQFFTIIDRKDERRKKRGSLSFSEMEQVKELEEDDEEQKVQSSSSSDWSEADSKNDRSQSCRKSRHHAAQCLACCTRVPRSKRQRKISSSSFRLRTDTESSYGNAADGSPISLKWRFKATSEIGSGESFSCGEGESELVLPVTPTIVSLTRVRRDVLKHVDRMCNPAWAKSSRQFLLQLRQSHQSVFQDVCLYSNVCIILSNSVCRVTARRFIQELFLELSFTQFYEDAETTLASYAPPASPTTPVTPSTSTLFPEEDTAPKNGAIASPTKNLTTVFEKFESFSACGTQSRQGSSQPSIKDDVPKT